MRDASAWIETLRLERHPEGGWFREIYRADESISAASLPVRFDGDRNFSTAIYFLLESSEFSALHRIRQDELWHFYEGSSLTIHVIDAARNYSTIKLGRNVDAGESLVAVVGASSLFGAIVDNASSFALVGCTVAPGFDFADFEMPGRQQLFEQYPEHRKIIDRLTH